MPRPITRSAEYSNSSRDNEIKTDLTEYDLRDLAQKVGGSQLLPENADFYVELTRAAAVIGSHSHDSSVFKMNGNTWRLWINSGEAMQGGPEMSGDAHEGLFVAEVPFYDGGQFTIPSGNPEDPFTLELLIEAALHSTQIREAEFQQAVAAVTQFGLYLSHECIVRAGLSRRTQPGQTDNDDIRWPGDEFATHLQEAVTFNKAEVVAEMRRRRLRTDVLKHLVFDLGSVSANYKYPLANPTLSRPVASLGEELIVVAPTNLLPAIRDAILNLAEANNVVPVLMSSVETIAWKRIIRFFENQKWEMIGHREAEASGEFDVGVFQFDDDKLAVVHLIVDDLTHGSREAGQQRWDLSQQFEAVRSSAVEVEKDLLARTDGVNEIMHVLLIHGAGRFYNYSPPELSSSGSPTVCMTLDELRVFSQLSSGDALALWQFAKSTQSRHGMVASVFGGFLDRFAQYRERSSFYHGDEGIPTITILFGLGKDVRLEAQAILDPHVVRMPNKAVYGRVYRLENLANFPIYATDPLQNGPVHLLVEGLPIPVWIVSPADGPAIPGDVKIAGKRWSAGVGLRNVDGEQVFASAAISGKLRGLVEAWNAIPQSERSRHDLAPAPGDPQAAQRPIGR